MSWEDLREGLLSMQLPCLGADQLRALLKFAVPLPDEAHAISLYLRVSVTAKCCIHKAARQQQPLPEPCVKSSSVPLSFFLSPSLHLSPLSLPLLWLATVASSCSHRGQANTPMLYWSE